MKKQKNRWELAQGYEKSWWKKKETHIGTEYFRNSADEIRLAYNKINTLKPTTKILEIGSGAFGIVSFLDESHQRFGIDPLEYYYSTVKEFVNQRDKKVKYLTAQGENLPFDNSDFDVIILDNVLDHCESPEKVISEILRITKPSAFVFFRQNTYNFYGKCMRAIMELFLIDKGHPYTFSKYNINKLFYNKFDLIAYNRVGYYQTWKAEIKSKRILDKVKALLFITRDKATYCWVKK